MSPATSQDSQSRHGRIIDCAIVLLMCVILATWTWHAAGDPVIDSARDLYTAQRMAQGAVLYHDLNYLFGPLAVSQISLLFRCFGDSANVVRVFDGIMVAATSLVLLDLLNYLCRRITSLAIALLFLLISGFAQFTQLRNYSFLLPYTHAATFGFALALITAAATVRALHARARPWLAVAGFACGLAILTKPEMALAAGVTLLFGWILSLFVRRPTGRASAIDLAWITTWLLVGSLVFGRLCCLPATLGESMHGIFAGYHMAIDPRIRAMRFYGESMGTRDGYRNAVKQWIWLCRYGWVLLPAFLLALMPARWARAKALLAAILFCAALTVPLITIGNSGWIDICLGIPSLVGLILGALLVSAAAHRRDRDRFKALASRLIFAAFAAALLLRMVLNARLYQYGFVQLVASLLLIALAGLEWLPAWLARLNRSPQVFQAAVAGLLLALTFKHVQIESNVLSQLGPPLAEGFVASGDEGALMTRLYNELRTHAEPGDTLAEAPEGCWLNFVLKLPNSTPDELLDPVGLIRSGGEAAVEQRYRASPPTWFIVFNRSNARLGASAFGIDYARDIRALLNERYTLIDQCTVNQSVAFLFRLKR